MPTTSEYLQDLKNQQGIIAANLTSCGEEADSTELLDTLIPKVLNLAPICVTGEWTPSADTKIFNLQNLPFKPYSINIIDYSLYGMNNCIMSFSFCKDIRSLVGGSILTNGSTSYLLSDSNEVVGITDNSILVNLAHGFSSNFKAGYTYKWIISKKQEV